MKIQLVRASYYKTQKNFQFYTEFGKRKFEIYLSTVCWKPGHLKKNEVKSGETKVSIIHKLDYKDCEIWFVRFSMDAKQKILALGNQLGKTYLWDMDTDDPAQCKFIMLSHAKCNSAIRQTSLSRDGSVLICACDDGTIWRWDRQT